MLKIQSKKHKNSYKLKAMYKMLSKNLILGCFFIVFLSCSNDSDDIDVTNGETIEEVDGEGVDDNSDEPSYEAEGFITIENGSAGLDAELEEGDRFGRDHDAIGDVNGDGVIDYVVGARSDDDGAEDAGAVYILLMNSDGSVSLTQKISMFDGGFDETLLAGNWFGYGVAGIGDYDNDGIPDIAVSAPVPPNNSLYIIHLDENGMVKDYVKNENIIAEGLTAIGDINGDNRIDLVACIPGSNDGGISRGAIDILFLNDDSQVIYNDIVTISSTQGNFGAGLEDRDQFGGREVAMLGDLDNDGNIEMAVGAFMSDGGKGAVWMLSLDSDTYNVVSKIKITEGLNGFNETLDLELNSNGSYGAQFGHAMCAAGDIDGDGITDLITGANQQNEGMGYILYLNADKTVKSVDTISATEGGFDLYLEVQDRFARSMSYVGDLKGDGSFAVNFGGGVGLGSSGSIYTLFFRPN